MRCFAWIKPAENDEVLRGIFRSVHSIKGTAGFFGLNNIVELSHTMENLFGELRDNRLQFHSAMIDPLLRGNDLLRQLIDHVADSEEMVIDEVIAAINGLLELDRPAGVVVAGSAAAELVSRVADDLQKEAPETQNVYQIELRVFGDEANNVASAATFRSQAESIGTLLQFFSGTEERAGRMETWFNAILSSILDKTLISFAFELPESDIVELPQLFVVGGRR